MANAKQSPIFTLQRLVEEAGKEMKLHLRQRLVTHPGELGVAREEVIREFLRTYLPQRFEIGAGFAFDSNGKVSEQLDIVVADRQVCPRFEAAGGVRFFPCESIVAVGQVKSSVKSRNELLHALGNLESAKALDRSAGGTSIDSAHHEPINNTTNHLHQIFAFLFVTGKSINGDAVREELMDYVLTRPPHLWTNILFAMDQYLITFCCEGGICPNPMDARGITLQKGSRNDGDTLLMKLYLLLGAAADVTRVSTPSYWEYLRNARTWTADVSYSAKDDVPPLLSSLSIR